jgi:Tol biopolymer transport system component
MGACSASLNFRPVTGAHQQVPQFVRHRVTRHLIRARDGIEKRHLADCAVVYVRHIARAVDLKTSHVSALPGAARMWSPRWSTDGRFIAGLSRYPVNKLMLYDLGTRKQTQLSDLQSECPTWSRDGGSLFFVADSGGWWRIWMRDRKVERVAKSFAAAGWGWYAAAPDNSLITARDPGTDEIYALDWEAP